MSQTATAEAKVIGLGVESLLGAELFKENQSQHDLDQLLNQLTKALQQTLDIRQLLEIFCRETSNFLPCDSVSYQHQEQAICHSHGQPKRHHCNYRLELQGEYLGDLSCTRATRFDATELAQLELLLCSLVYPLRNALLYRTALTSALHDPLTGFGNRAALDNALEREIELAKRNNMPFTVLMIDIDHFKDINDQFGHSSGDKILQEVSKEIARESRCTDMIFRYGGEEFLLLLNNTDINGAAYMAQRIRQSVQSLKPSCQNKQNEVTVSIGVASLNPDDNSDSLFEKADKALYEAKDTGRNKVVVSPQ